MGAQTLYFSYGSNMDADKMRTRCPEAEFLGVAYLPDYELVFTSHLDQRNRGGADILHRPGARVWGILYRLTPEDVRRLDGNKVFPEVYTRFRVTVTQLAATGELPVAEVWTYALTDKTQAGHRPTPEYQALLVAAARRYQFPPQYVNYLESFLIA